MTYSKILIIQTAFLGDVVLTTPLFRAVKRLWPEADLTLLTTPQAKPLVEEDPYLDEIITFDKKGDESLLSIISKVRGGGYDLLISTHRSHRTSLITLLSGISTRVGFTQSGFSWVYNRKARRPMALHEVDRNLALLTALGEEIVDSDKVLHAGCTDKERAVVDDLLKAHGVTEHDKIVGIAPGSVWATKRWTAEGFAGVGGELSKRGYKVALIGGPDDVEVAGKVAEHIGPSVINAAGKTPLKALSAWMERFDLFISNDSSPLHVAAAKEVPTVAVFGATVRELGFYPYHENSRLVEVPLDCRPCGLHGGDECPEGHFRCMGEVTVDMVLAACDELVGQR